MDAYEIFTGVWTNYFTGGAGASEWTLSTFAGGFLLSAVATFVALVGTQFWTTAAFIAHQCRAKPGLHDGIHEVHQVVYRNSSALGSAWTIFTASVAYSGRKSWYWPRRVSKPYTNRRKRRAIMSILFPIFIWGLFTAAGPLSSLVAAKAYKANEVTVKPQNCGFLSWDQGKEGLLALQAYTRDSARQALAYVNQCYNTTDSVACEVLPQQKIEYGVTQTNDCPFGNRCKAPPITMETEWMDSHKHFGINAPKSDRVQLRKQAACAVVDVDDLTKKVLAYNGSVYSYLYYLGPVPGESEFTGYAIERQAIDNVGYGIQPYYAYQGQEEQNPWQPIADFNSTSGDVSLFIISFGALYYEVPVHDPLFSATTPDDAGGFLPDSVAGLVACVDRYQLRDPSSAETTDPGSVTQTLQRARQLAGANPARLAAASRLLIPGILTEMYQSAAALGTAALRAQLDVFRSTSLGLPADQWQVEVRGWFETALASLQHAVVAYASKGGSALGPHARLTRGSSDDTAVRAQLDAMCDRQKIRNVARYQTFSVLGLAVILAVGVVIIVVSLAQDTVVGFFGAADARMARWRVDSLLQLQRLAYQHAGQGEWERCREKVPVARGVLELPDLDGEMPGYVALAKLDPDGRELLPGRASEDGERGVDVDGDRVSRGDEEGHI